MLATPWENGYNERCNGTLRSEVLNAAWFTTTKQAQITINGWLRQYNHTRPHQAINMRPPVSETLIRNGPNMGTRQGALRPFRHMHAAVQPNRAIGTAKRRATRMRD
ncbi:integrase core domain-containing protein [Ruegeria jejuensis]|uniref:integrase core domain-containing protein n=1 Tax=Ruegeria jejuensis TaxID=3233338 RepID=UPI00355C7A17